MSFWLDYKFWITTRSKIEHKTGKHLSRVFLLKAEGILPSEVSDLWHNRLYQEVKKMDTKWSIIDLFR